jgi:cell shape-determining protein MreC
VVLVTALLLTAALAVISILTGMNPGDLFVKGVLTPLRTGVSTLTDRAEQFYGYLFRYEALLAENQALKAELAQLQEDAANSAAVQRENDRLRDLVELRKKHPDYELVDSYVIGRSSLDWTSTLTVNVGKRSGVDVGMVAITANGEVVGLVTEAGPNYAVVKTVLDSSLEMESCTAMLGSCYCRQLLGR